MLRFPNPGSTVSNFVAVYTAAYKRLHGNAVSLDDIAETTVDANLVTSSGYMGSEAISRSTRSDRSLDPVYNQIKMYAELFRILGWLHPTQSSALTFTFTLLGGQVVAAGANFLPLFGETNFGIAYPSHILSVKGQHDLRPFSSILKIMLLTGGILSRDEMIIGPLNATSDRGEEAVSNMASVINQIRNDPNEVKQALEKVAASRKIQVNTLRNYTRWPIAVLRDCGWVEKIHAKYPSGKTFQAFRLTPMGKKISTQLTASADIRVDQVDPLPIKEKSAISFEAHFRMLERSGFDISLVEERLSSQKPDLNRALDKLNIPRDQPFLFSPFQSLSISDIQTIFSTSNESSSIPDKIKVIGGSVTGRGNYEHLFVKPNIVELCVSLEGEEAKALEAELIKFNKIYKSREEAAEAYALCRATDTQIKFYPLISQLFQILGFRCEHSRAGVNYQRWDACVWLEDIAIPIEIKSPTEELFLSTKAIRQALENKIVLLARGSLNTDKQITSLIVGYQYPNERGDMTSLIDDLYSAYEISIGVIDLKTLVELAIGAVVDGKTIDNNQFGQLRGFLSA